MKYIALAVCVGVLSGCSTPNPSPKATAAAYEQVTCGMSRKQVYELLGQPQSVEPAGDIEHCRSATWGIPHDSHGWGHWTAAFTGDIVTEVKMGNATLTISN
jgi:hypothetical protein